MSRSNSVKRIAIDIPNAATRFPVRAVRGWLSCRMPTIRQTPATRYAKLIQF
jgi:hypothetical protein